jgi:hypothetical protein
LDDAQHVRGIRGLIERRVLEVPGDKRVHVASRAISPRAAEPKSQISDPVVIVA